jgi:alanine racemase
MEVSLENLRHNYRAIYDHVGVARVISVVKADAYGLGAIPAAWALKAEGADFFAVATPDEAIELRDAGITDPILVLGTSSYDAADMYVRLGISSALTDIRMAEELSRASRRFERPASVHLKVDTGMGRIGFLPEEALSAAQRANALPGIDIEGIFTHFATADEKDLTRTRGQFSVFSSVARRVRDAGIPVRMAHCCNSGAILADLSDMFMDAVRPGHMLCGLMPSHECGDAVPVKPCFEVKTAIGAIRELPAGTGISYGLTYATEDTERVAVLPVGYADGFNRGLSNAGDVLIRGKRCPIRGRICMDQCVAGVSHLEDAEVGDEVVLIGRQGDDAITIDEVAEKLSTISGTIPTSFTARLPKVYV